MSTGPIPMNLPRVSPNINPGATPASTPITPDPHVTRDGNMAARAITAPDKSDNPVNDRTRERNTRSTVTENQHSPSRQQALPTGQKHASQAFSETETASIDSKPYIDTYV